jgi:L-lactate dehydrogenase complex protein LldE
VRVGLFVTCLVDALFPHVGESMVTLLRRLDVDVEVPMTQTCCGQMHINTGYTSMAVPLLRNQFDAFDAFDVVVAPSASCVGTIRHQYGGVVRESGDETLLRAAEALAGKTYELSEFLVDVLGVVNVGAYYPHVVTYHPTCHSLRALHVGERPQRLLHAVEGIKLIELPNAQTCCGFGGTFALKNSDVSAAMLNDKLECVLATGASVLTASDSSCLMHMGGGLSRVDERVRPVHLAEILASSR